MVLTLTLHVLKLSRIQVYIRKCTFGHRHGVLRLRGCATLYRHIKTASFFLQNLLPNDSLVYFGIFLMSHERKRTIELGDNFLSRTDEWPVEKLNYNTQRFHSSIFSSAITSSIVRQWTNSIYSFCFISRFLLNFRILSLIKSTMARKNSRTIEVAILSANSQI